MKQAPYLKKKYFSNIFRNIVGSFKHDFNWTTIKNKFKLLDYPILILTCILVLIGFFAVFSATMYMINPETGTSNPMGYLMTQYMAVLISIIAIILLLLLPFQLFNEFPLLVFVQGFVVFLLILTIFIGDYLGGARSWIYIGSFSLQPSELAKLITVLVISYLVSHFKREVILSKEVFSSRTTAVSIFLFFLTLFLIFDQPDVGMFLIILATTLLIFLPNYFTLKTNLVSICIGFILYVLIYSLANSFSEELVNSGRYQLERLGSFVDPFAFPQTAGYQLINGYLAFSRGGLFGVGIGKGITKRGALPAAHTDFILAVIGEETGFIGVMFVIILLFGLIFYLYRCAAKCQLAYNRNVISGIASLLFIQSLINIGGIAGIIPLTGVTLPLISSGGTSMIVNLVAIGLAEVFIVGDKQYKKDKHPLNIIN